MPDGSLPEVPPPGKKRYRMVCRDRGVNPFKSRSFEMDRPLQRHTKTVDVDEHIPFEQVEKWAREEQGPYEFLKLEVVS